MVLVGDQYAQYLVTGHITLLGLWAKVIIVLPVVGSLFFCSYFGCLLGTLFENASLR